MHTKLEVVRKETCVPVCNTKLAVCYQDLPVGQICVQQQEVPVPICNEYIDIQPVEIFKDVVNCNVRVEEIVQEKEICTEKLRVKKVKKDVYTEDGLDDDKCLKKRCF